MNVQFSNLIKSRWALPAAAGVVGFVGGYAAGYIYDKRKSEEQVFTYSPDDFTSDEEDEIDEIRESLNASFDKFREEQLKSQVDHPAGSRMDEVSSVAVDLDELVEEDVEDVEEPVVSIFSEETDDSWDWDVELKKRSSDAPYVIHEDEYMSNDEDSQPQMTATYYEGDDIMADENDTPIYNWRDIIGTLHFGHGSRDANTFYVRNERMKHDYEIIRDGGKFAEVVLGLEEEQAQEQRELKHSRNMRFRPDD